MFYKTSWGYRLQKESQKYSKSYPDYQILTSSSNRVKPYSEEEINKMILLKKQQITDEEIAKRIGRTYWSVVYKLSDLRKRGIYL